MTRMLRKEDVALAAATDDQFDFLVDIVPRCCSMAQGTRPRPRPPMEVLTAKVEEPEAGHQVGLGILLVRDLVPSCRCTTWSWSPARGLLGRHRWGLLQGLKRRKFTILVKSSFKLIQKLTSLVKSSHILKNLIKLSPHQVKSGQNLVKSSSQVVKSSSP